MIEPLPVKPLGDTAFVLRVAGESPATLAGSAATLAEAIRREAPPGTVDVVPALDTVTVFYNIAQSGDAETFAASLRRIAGRLPREADGCAGTLHEIPVVYGGEGGPDLDELCASHGLDRPAFIARHTAPAYVVQAIGFTPGFPYLGGLPPELATPRRETPRPLVPAGSVGIGGAQTGIYPFATPGGWHIVGRTAVRLFDADREPPALLRTGDRVRFVEASGADQAAEARAVATPTTTTGEPVGPAMRIGRPGLMTTIQDLGRPGYRSLGVPLSGAADPLALRLANLIVGNEEHTAGLECTLVGPELTFECDAVVALTGGDFSGLPRFRPVRVAAGETISLGHARQGCRGYLAIAGGVQVRPQLGSRSTYVPARLSGLAGSLLRQGDRVPIEADSLVVRGRWSMSGDVAPLPPAAPLACELRIISADDTAAEGRSLAGLSWRTSSRSDRMGVRLEGTPLAGGRADLVSAAVAPGTIQLPPDGQPIILLADAQTIGGYAVVGHVIAVDLRLAAQLRPGDLVTFKPVTLAEAHAASHAQEATVAMLSQALAGRVCRQEGPESPT